MERTRLIYDQAKDLSNLFGGGSHQLYIIYVLLLEAERRRYHAVNHALE